MTSSAEQLVMINEPVSAEIPPEFPLVVAGKVAGSASYQLPPILGDDGHQLSHRQIAANSAKDALAAANEARMNGSDPNAAVNRVLDLYQAFCR